VHLEGVDAVNNLPSRDRQGAVSVTGEERYTMQQRSESPRDLPRTILAVLCIGTLIVAVAWILLPFLSASVWAATIVISTWPVMLRIQAWLGGRRGLATVAMTVALLLVVLIPVSLSVGALVNHMDDIAAKIDSLAKITVPPPPEWVSHIPLQGPKLSAQWQSLSAQGPGSLSAAVTPYGRSFLRWSAQRIGGVGAMTLQFLLTVIISVALYAKGETAARGIRKFAFRLAGAHGERAAVLAAKTVQGVAMGVIVTALIQTTIGGAGLMLTSVPGAGLITAAVLICCLAQIGPIFAMLPAVIWKFSRGDTVSGFVLLVFMLVAGTIDNFIRPILIRKGADLPIFLIIGGVIGGMIGLGVMGIFVGPVVLAVSYVLLREWIELQPETQDTVSTRSSTAASV
jgi:predicted PurR-regulated permease PerM